MGGGATDYRSIVIREVHANCNNCGHHDRSRWLQGGLAVLLLTKQCILVVWELVYKTNKHLKWKPFAILQWMWSDGIYEGMLCSGYGRCLVSGGLLSDASSRMSAGLFFCSCSCGNGWRSCSTRPSPASKLFIPSQSSGQKVIQGALKGCLVFEQWPWLNYQETGNSAVLCCWDNLIEVIYYWKVSAARERNPLSVASVYRLEVCLLQLQGRV